MKEIKITKDSINKVNHVMSNMEGKTFHNHYHILYDICESYDNDNIVYLEIGAFAGGSASLVSMSEKVKKVYSIDIGNPINKEIPIRNVNKFKHNQCDYEYIHGNSNSDNIVKYVSNKIPKIDILFIDGDHKFDAVINDFHNYKDLVINGGYIVFDDYLDEFHSPEVKGAVDSIAENLNKNEYEVIGSLNYDLLLETNVPNLPSSNEFILKKIF